jgi:hypothetical protein
MAFVDGAARTSSDNVLKKRTRAIPIKEPESNDEEEPGQKRQKVKEFPLASAKLKNDSSSLQGDQLA